MAGKGEWVIVLLHCGLQPLAEDVVASIALWQMSELFSWLLRLPELSAVALNLEWSDASGVTLGSCFSEHKGRRWFLS